MSNKISVIVPIYNRPDELSELLESIYTAYKPEDFTYEIVVVEDGSSITSKDVCDSYSDKMQILYLEKNNSGPGASRNYGMEHASGEYFVILDSDCLVPSDYFITLNKLISSTTPPDAISGPDRAHPSFTDIQKAINYAMTSFFTTGGLRGGKGNMSGKRQLRSYNMVISKKTYDTAGGFARQRVGEDIEYTHRIWRNDLTTAWDEDLFVYHKRRTSLDDFFRQVYHFGMARPILNRMFPGTAKLTYMFPSFFLGFMALSLLAGVFAPGLMILLLLYLLTILVSATYINKSFIVGLLSVAASVFMFVGYGWGFIYSSCRLIYYEDVEKAFPYMFKH
ncbi:MAG: glycosyltransferase [Flavobacteriales bacterium]|nr:glycosyltransferase [Flavobacteriales bacterium]